MFGRGSRYNMGRGSDGYIGKPEKAHCRKCQKPYLKSDYFSVCPECIDEIMEEVRICSPNQQIKKRQSIEPAPRNVM